MGGGGWGPQPEGVRAWSVFIEGRAACSQVGRSEHGVCSCGWAHSQVGPERGVGRGFLTCSSGTIAVKLEATYRPPPPSTPNWASQQPQRPPPSRSRQKSPAGKPQHSALNAAQILAKQPAMLPNPRVPPQGWPGVGAAGAPSETRGGPGRAREAGMPHTGMRAGVGCSPASAREGCPVREVPGAGTDVLPTSGQASAHGPARRLPHAHAAFQTRRSNPRLRRVGARVSADRPAPWAHHPGGLSARSFILPLLPRSSTRGARGPGRPAGPGARYDRTRAGPAGFPRRCAEPAL